MNVDCAGLVHRGKKAPRDQGPPYLCSPGVLTTQPRHLLGRHRTTGVPVKGVIVGGWLNFQEKKQEKREQKPSNPISYMRHDQRGVDKQKNEGKRKKDARISPDVR